MKNLLKVEDLRKDLFVGDFGDCICEYDKGYICDIITEIADAHVDIYTHDLLEWAKDNYSYIDEASQEFGRASDFLAEIRQGQFYCFERDLYNNLEDILKLFTYVYIQNVLDIDEITEEQDGELFDYDYMDSSNELEYIIEHIEKVFEK